MPDTLPYQDLVVREIEQQGDARAKAMATELGPAPGYEPLSDAKELEYWSRADPTIDVDTLLAQGQSIEEITKAKHPDRVRLIEMGRPKWTERVEYAEKMAQKALMQGSEKSNTVKTLNQSMQSIFGGDMEVTDGSE